MKANDLKWKPAPDVLVQMVDGEAVLLDMAHEIYFGLNPSGALIWQQLQAGASEQDLQAALRTKYPSIKASVLDADLQALLAALKEKRLLVAA